MARRTVRKPAPRAKKPPARQFKQARSERTYLALLAAGEQLFSDRGYDATQTPDVAEAAGVSTGALYRYFADKRQLFLEIMSRHLDSILAEVTGELRPERFVTGDASSARAGIDLVLEVLFARLRRNAPLERVFLAVSLRDADVMAMRARFERLSVELLTRMIEDLIPRSVIPKPRAAAVVIHAAALEVASERAGLSPDRGAGVADREVREALREMIHRYLYPGAR